MVPRAVDGVWNEIAIDGTTMQEAIASWWEGEVPPTFLADPPWDAGGKPPELRPPWTGKGDPPVPWWTSRFMTNPTCKGFPWY